jgi:hypothetical protein
VPIEDFAQEDRERTLELLLSQERVVTLLYSKVFPVAGGGGGKGGGGKGAAGGVGLEAPVPMDEDEAAAAAAAASNMGGMHNAIGEDEASNHHEH